MKRFLSFILALFLCFPLCACGGSNAIIKAETPTEASDNSVIKIGETFGTDNVECMIKEITWFTSEEFEGISDSNDRFAIVNGKTAIIQGDYLTLDTANLFPGCHVWGITGVVKEKVSENVFLCVKHSLQNIGKEVVDCGMESDGFMGMISVPYGTMEVIYDDGYTFGFGDNDFGKYVGFTTRLNVLTDPVEEVMIINLPNQVLENTDKALMLKVSLPTANGEMEEFLVSVR